MAVIGQIKSKPYSSKLGFIMANPIKAADAIMPPINSHFHASPSPIIPIPATNNCKILLSIQVLLIRGSPEFSPIKKPTMKRPLNPRRIQRNSLYDLVLMLVLSLVLSYSFGFSVSPRFLLKWFLDSTLLFLLPLCVVSPVDLVDQVLYKTGPKFLQIFSKVILLYLEV